MQRTPHVFLFAAVAALLGGCAYGQGGDEGSLVLENSGEEGKADSVAGKELGYLAYDDRLWRGESVEVRSDVLKHTSNYMRIGGDRLVFELPQPGTTLKLAAYSGNNFELFGRRAFLLFYNRVEPAEGEIEGRISQSGWQPVLCSTTTPGGDTLVSNYAPTVEIDPEYRQLHISDEASFLEEITGTAETFTFSYEDCGIPQGEPIVIGALPFVSRDLGDLEGEYWSLIEARCGDGACPRPDLHVEYR